MNGGDFQHFIGEWWKAGLLLVDRHHDLEAAHVGTQDLGDRDGAVGVLVVLQMAAMVRPAGRPEPLRVCR